MSGHGGPAAGVTFHYTVDGEAQETTEHVLTVEQILRNAEIDPAQRYLIQLVGAKQESYENKLGEQIHMHEKMTFITAGLGPTTVS